MIGYDPSYLNETETLLEEFHKIQKYLIENPIYKIYQANVDYETSVNEYYITDVTTRSGDMLGVGDVVLFRNVYYGVITEINEDTQMFTIAEGISFRGPTGARGLRGEIGATGATGANGLEYFGAVVQFEYDGDEFDEPLTFNNSDFNRTPTINDGFLFMYHLNESNLSYIVNGRVTAVGTDTCRVTISPQARQEVTGPIGPVGANGLSIYLYDGEITSTTTTATTAQAEVPTGRTLQVYDILFSTYETTYGAMAEVTEIQGAGLRVDYIGQVAGAGGGESLENVDIISFATGAEEFEYVDGEGLYWRSPVDFMTEDYHVLFTKYQNAFAPICAGEGIEFVQETDAPFVTINAKGSGGGVSDVQINGTSIVSDGVANIPYASGTQAGVVSTGEQSFGGAKTFNGAVQLNDTALLTSFLEMQDGTIEATGARIRGIGRGLRFETRSSSNLSNLRYMFCGGTSSIEGYIAFMPTGDKIRHSAGGSQYNDFLIPQFNAQGQNLTLSLMAQVTTWSTGTSGSVKLSSSGLYEVKVTKTFGEYDTDIVAFINFAKDGTKGAISTAMSFVGTSGVSTGFVVVDPTGVMNFFDTAVGEGDTSITLSYRKIGIA
jgi:hypothetical protein